MEDLIEQANEIQESLGRSYGVPDEVDEADLQAGQSHASPTPSGSEGIQLIHNRAGRAGSRRRPDRRERDTRISARRTGVARLCGFGPGGGRAGRYAYRRGGAMMMAARRPEESSTATHAIFF